MEGNIGDLIDSDEDLHGGDREDNVSEESRDSRESSVSLGGKKGKVGEDDEFNLNISFTGGYMPNTDLSRVDKGQGNP